MLGVVVGLLVGAGAGAGLMAWRYPSPDTSPIDNAQQPVRVTGVVSQQPVRVVFSLSGTVSAPSEQVVAPHAVGEAGTDVVTGRPRAGGDVIQSTQLLAEVSNRPVFAFPAGVPLYRDLVPDLAGSDVAAVQRVLIEAGLLAGEPSGVVDDATSAGLDAMFTAAGYRAPLMVSVIVPTNGRAPRQARGLPLADTAPIPSGGLVVASAAPVGTVLDGEHPLLTLIVRPAVITARADLLAAPHFEVGAAVVVQVGAGTPMASTVLAVSGFDSGQAGYSPGYDVTIAVPEGVDPAEALDQPVLIDETETPALGPAVPLLAVRTDGGSTYVYKAGDVPIPESAEGATGSAPTSPASTGSTGALMPDVRVAVRVVGQANGYAILADNPDLPVGTEVVLSGERP